jgi:sulfopyruvate decarboxylase subunit alpha
MSRTVSVIALIDSMPGFGATLLTRSRLPLALEARRRERVVGRAGAGTCERFEADRASSTVRGAARYRRAGDWRRPIATAEAIPARRFHQAIQAAGVTDVVAVPDTHQRSLIAEIERAGEPRFIQTSTEDEAIALAAGLVVGGRRPLIQIQHAGLYACVNHLRGIADDGRVPLVFLIGLLGRDTRLAPDEHGGSMVRLAEPLLDTFRVPRFLLDGVEDLDHVAAAFELADERSGPVALLVGEATA